MEKVVATVVNKLEDTQNDSWTSQTQNNSLQTTRNPLSLFVNMLLGNLDQYVNMLVGNLDEHYPSRGTSRLRLKSSMGETRNWCLDRGDKLITADVKDFFEVGEH